MPDRRIRPWIKQRLADSNDARQAVRIWERWKAAKMAAKNVARAIRLYDTLVKGDGASFHKLMVEFFPGYGLSLGPSRPELERAAPAPSANGNHRPKAAPAKIVISKEAFNEAEEDDDLGFGNLEIG